MATIKAIEGRSVHQIQSGQVIVDLNSVVKELVENSLDAGASSIEVRFKNNGLDSIEVQDNGKGIAPEDYETIALKHYTSKLSSYEDLTSLETFGFRGEALSSLCALSKFQILTARAEDGAVGRRLEFEVSGKLKGASVVAAQKGTTVAVEDLFHSLPVRRKELEKNIKREYSKVINLLNAYACISVGVRYSVSNIMPKGKKVVVFSTKSNTTTRENIVNVFGSKTLLALVKLDLKLEMEPGKGPSTQSSRNRSTQAADRSKDVQVEGHISKPVFGEGRQAPDRQMFFVNSRPCALPQVSKAVNEVYKSFNVTQSPFIFANLVMDTNAYDVNVSPDKRTIMLHDQTALLDSLKAALTDLFEHTDHTVPQSTLPNRKLPSYKPLTVQKQTSTISSQDAEEESDDEKEQPGSREESPAPRVSSSRKNSSGEPASLIESWAGRDSDMRKTRTAAPTLGTSILGQAHPRSNGQRTDKAPAVTVPSHAASTVILHAAVPPGEDRSETADGHKTTAQMAVSSEAYEQNPMSTSYDDPFSQRPPELPRKVQDFNSYIERSRNAHNDSIAVAHEVAEEQLKSTEGSPQPSIPAVKSSTQKPTPGPVPNAFDRMRPKRTPLQTAEITVGDQTTTTIIGSSPAYKKRRVHEPVNSQAVAAFGCSPLLARGLRSFAAPGTQMAIDGSEVPLRRNQPSDESEDAEDDNDDEGERAEDEAEDSASEAGDAGDRPENTSDQSETDVGDGSTPRRQRQRIEPTNTRLLNSDALDDLSPAPAVDDEWDEEYIDENENRMIEDEKITRMIQAAEKAAARPSSQNLSRAFQILKSSSSRKDSTLKLACRVETDVDEIRQQATASTDLLSALAAEDKSCDADVLVNDEVDATQAENKLSLTVTKADFSRMRIIGQFNLGFILAVRPATTPTEQDELFIIDQHAADEKYNYERLQRTVTLQSQRLVRPKTLDLTAVEQEIVLTHSDALKANGFEIETTTSPSSSPASPSSAPSLDQPETRTSRLLTLPTSHTTTFTLSDLSELLHLLSETSPESSHIPRPKKVQRMLAMRACRSSIMVGKSLTVGQMERVVRHMGEMEKPWNCPHGRPTMRHLAGLGAWRGWREGELIDADVASSGQGGYGRTDWRGYLSKR